MRELAGEQVLLLGDQAIVIMTDAEIKQDLRKQ